MLDIALSCHDWGALQNDAAANALRFGYGVGAYGVHLHIHSMLQCAHSAKSVCTFFLSCSHGYFRALPVAGAASFLKSRLFASLRVLQNADKPCF